MKTQIIANFFLLQFLFVHFAWTQPCTSVPGQIFCNSSCYTAGLTIFGDGTGGGMDAMCNNCTNNLPAYQWQKNEGSGWANINGAIGKNYTIPSLNVSTDFKRIATCDGTVMEESNVVTVNPTPPAPTITPNGPTTFCQGGNVVLNSSANTGNQWFKNGVVIPGATNQSYTATESGNYTVKQTVSGCQSGASNIITVTVNPTPPAPTITPSGPTTFCQGGNVVLSSSATTGNQWFKNGVEIPGATNQSYTATESGNYTVKQTVSGCQSGASNTIAVTVNAPPPAPIITPNGPTTFCQGGNVVLNSSANTGNQWFKNGVVIPGATNQSYTATESGSYTVKQTVSGCQSSASNAITVTVNPIPPAPAITPNGPTTFCQGGNVLLNSSANTGNQWFKNGVEITGATNQSYSATESGSYTVKQTVAGCQSGASNAITVTVNPIPPAPTITPNGPTTFCQGGNVVLNSSAGAGNQWFKNGVEIPGATNQNFPATDSGSYTVKQTVLGCQSGASNVIQVKINPLPPTPANPGKQDPRTCRGSDGSITFSGYNGLNSYEISYDSNGIKVTRIITSDNMGRIELTGLREGSYKNFAVRDRKTDCTSAVNTITVTLSDPRKPDRPANISSLPRFLCGTDTWVTISVDPSSGVSYQWDVTPKQFTPGSGTPAHQVRFKPDRDSLDYLITVTRTDDRTQCTSDPTSISLPVYRNPKSIILGPDMICEGDAQTLNALGSGGQSPYKYDWFVNGSQASGVDKLPLQSLPDGIYDVELKVTDGRTCNNLDYKRVTVKNVPDFQVEMSSKMLEGQREFSPKLKNGTLMEIDSVIYEFFDRTNSTKFVRIKRDTLSFIESLIPGHQYALDIKVVLKNKCLICITKLFSVNSTECRNIKKPELFLIRKNPGDTSKVAELGLDIPSTVKVCDLDNLKDYFISVSWPGLQKYEIKYQDSIYTFTGSGTINLNLGFISLIRGNNTIRTEVKYIRQGDTLQCNLDFNIVNQTFPEVGLEQNHFCHTSPIALKFTSDPKERISFNFNGKTYAQIGTGSIDTIAINKTDSLNLFISNIKQDNNECPAYSDTFGIYVYRRPVLDFRVDKLCRNDSTRLLITTYTEDSKAKFVWTNNGRTFIPTNNSIAGNSNSLSIGDNLLKVMARIDHRKSGSADSIFCMADTMRTIKVHPLPLAQIAEYTPGCGPFFTIGSLYEPENDVQTTKFMWRFSKGNSIPVSFGSKVGNEYVYLTGKDTGDLILSAISKEGCYHHDTLKLGSRNFELEQDTAKKIRASVCGDSSLYFVENTLGGECYKWFILDTPNFRIYVVDQDKPFIKTDSSTVPFLLRYPCGQTCQGTLVERNSGEYDRDCDEEPEGEETPYQIFPNPATHQLNIRSDHAPKGMIQIRIHDGYGQVLDEIRVWHPGGTFGYELDVSSYPFGIYYLNINGTIRKIIVLN